MSKRNLKNLCRIMPRSSPLDQPLPNKTHCSLPLKFFDILKWALPKLGLNASNPLKTIANPKIHIHSLSRSPSPSRRRRSGAHHLTPALTLLRSTTCAMSPVPRLTVGARVARPRWSSRQHSLPHRATRVASQPCLTCRSARTQHCCLGQARGMPGPGYGTAHACQPPSSSRSGQHSQAQSTGLAYLHLIRGLG